MNTRIIFCLIWKSILKVNMKTKLYYLCNLFSLKSIVWYIVLIEFLLFIIYSISCGCLFLLGGLVGVHVIDCLLWLMCIFKPTAWHHQNSLELSLIYQDIAFSHYVNFFLPLSFSEILHLNPYGSILSKVFSCTIMQYS